MSLQTEITRNMEYFREFYLSKVKKSVAIPVSVHFASLRPSPAYMPILLIPWTVGTQRLRWGITYHCAHSKKHNAGHGAGAHSLLLSNNEWYIITIDKRIRSLNPKWKETAQRVILLLNGKSTAIREATWPVMLTAGPGFLEPGRWPQWPMWPAGECGELEGISHSVSTCC